MQMRDEFWDTAPHYGGQKGTLSMGLAYALKECMRYAHIVYVLNFQFCQVLLGPYFKIIWVSSNNPTLDRPKTGVTKK